MNYKLNRLPILTERCNNIITKYDSDNSNSIDYKFNDYGYRASFDYESLLDSERLIHWEYKGNLFPLKNILFLTGKTLDHIKHHGWDLEPYAPEDSTFSPVLSPQPTSPDLSLGGIVLKNTTLKEVEVEILVMN
jgi:hypothetical protein